MDQGTRFSFSRDGDGISCSLFPPGQVIDTASNRGISYCSLTSSHCQNNEHIDTIRIVCRNRTLETTLNTPTVTNRTEQNRTEHNASKSHALLIRQTRSLGRARLVSRHPVPILQRLTHQTPRRPPLIHRRTRPPGLSRLGSQRRSPTRRTAEMG